MICTKYRIENIGLKMLVDIERYGICCIQILTRSNVHRQASSKYLVIAVDIL